jgi:sugar phosphate permease
MKQDISVLDMTPVSQSISHHRLLPWFMWSLGALFYCYEFCLQVSPSVMTNEIMREFSVSASELGHLSAFYLYAYTLMQIPVGILLDRYGPRRLLTIAILFCATGSLLLGTAKIFAIAALGRFLIGIGSSFAPVGCMHLAATWLPINRFALMTGMMLTIGMIGAVTGEAPLSMMVAKLGWRETLILFGAIGFVLSLIIWSIVRDRSLQTDKRIISKSEGFLSGIRYVLKNKQIWVVAIYGGLMYLPTPAFAGLWGVSFLMSSYSLTRTTAAFFISLIFIGWAVGAPLFGWFSDRISKRLPPMIIGGIGALITIIGILYISNMALFIIGTLLFLFGFFSSGFLPAFSVAREINPPETNATALGFVNTLNNLGGALAQPFIGLILDWQWQGSMENGVRIYTVTDYHTALITLPVCIVIAICFLPFIRETYCKPVITRT